MLREDAARPLSFFMGETFASGFAGCGPSRYQDQDMKNNMYPELVHLLEDHRKAAQKLAEAQERLRVRIFDILTIYSDAPVGVVQNAQVWPNSKAPDELVTVSFESDNSETPPNSTVTKMMNGRWRKTISIPKGWLDQGLSRYDLAILMRPY